MKKLIYILLFAIVSSANAQPFKSYSAKFDTLKSYKNSVVMLPQQFRYSLGLDTGLFDRNTLVPAGWVLDRIGSGSPWQTTTSGIEYTTQSGGKISVDPYFFSAISSDNLKGISLDYENGTILLANDTSIFEIEPDQVGWQDNNGTMINKKGIVVNQYECNLTDGSPTQAELSTCLGTIYDVGTYRIVRDNSNDDAYFIITTYVSGISKYSYQKFTTPN